MVIAETHRVTTAAPHARAAARRTRPDCRSPRSASDRLVPRSASRAGCRRAPSPLHGASSQLEAHHRNRDAGDAIRGCARDARRRRVLGGRLARDDDERCARRARRAARATGRGQQPRACRVHASALTSTRSTTRAARRCWNASSSTATSRPARAASRDSRNPVGDDDHRNVRVEHRVHQRLVVAVAAQHDRRRRAALAQLRARATRRPASCPFRRP